jgi:hypothetical protein
MSHIARVAVVPVEQRAFPRRSVNFSARVRELGAVASDVVVTDISRFGCRLENCDLPENAEIWLKLPECEPARARIVWNLRGEAGREFYCPIHDTAVAAQRSPSQRRRVIFGLPRRR